MSEKNLALTVLNMALTDYRDRRERYASAKTDIQCSKIKMETDTARYFLSRTGDDWEKSRNAWVKVAGLEPEYFNERVKERILKNECRQEGPEKTTRKYEQ